MHARWMTVTAAEKSVDSSGDVLHRVCSMTTITGTLNPSTRLLTLLHWIYVQARLTPIPRLVTVVQFTLIALYSAYNDMGEPAK